MQTPRDGHGFLQVTRSRLRVFLGVSTRRWRTLAEFDFQLCIIEILAGTRLSVLCCAGTDRLHERCWSRDCRTALDNTIAPPESKPSRERQFSRSVEFRIVPRKIWKLECRHPSKHSSSEGRGCCAINVTIGLRYLHLLHTHFFVFVWHQTPSFSRSHPLGLKPRASWLLLRTYDLTLFLHTPT